jgi:CPA1 family monovalent cation:H+ antiporter
MSLFTIISLVITITGLFAYINYRFIKLPNTIGLMAIAIIFSLFLVFLQLVGFRIENQAISILKQIHFDRTLIDGILSFLLFAGSLHVDLSELKRQKWVIFSLALLGTLASTFIIGTIMYYAFQIFGLQVPWVYSYLFGALISPTDPIAVMAMLKNAHADHSLQVKIAGESLFNDGVGIVIFLTILQLVTHSNISIGNVTLLFFREAVGGILFGLILFWVAYFLMKTVKDYFVLILITLAIVTGGYTLALYLEVSGPIAMVVAGIFIGNHGKYKVLEKKAQKYLDIFWEVIDEVLNSVLFVLIGLEILIVKFTSSYIFAGLVAIFVVLFARFVSVWVPITLFRMKKQFVDRVVFILTWGGLRGGLCVAMALSIPPSPNREIILTATYIVMAFSVLVQGLTMQTSVIPKPKS